jgi:hypothetical protein
MTMATVLAAGGPARVEAEARPFGGVRQGV